MFHSVDDYYCHVYLFSSLTRESGLEAKAVFATETPLTLLGGGGELEECRPHSLNLGAFKAPQYSRTCHL